MMADDEERLMRQGQNNESDFIDFDGPEIIEDRSSSHQMVPKAQQRIVLKYPDGSQSLGKLKQALNVIQC